MRILEGGRLDGRLIDSTPGIHVGGEYVVVAMSGDPSHGVRYTLLSDKHPHQTRVWPAQMFEILNPVAATSWRAVDAYGDGRLISLEPEPWLIDRFWERKEALDPEALAAFLRGIAQLYDEEQEPVPAEVSEWLDRLEQELAAD